MIPKYSSHLVTSRALVDEDQIQVQQKTDDKPAVRLSDTPTLSQL